MKKEHFEILLENIQDKVQTIAEGHIILNNKIDVLSVGFHEALHQTRDELMTMFKVSMEHMEERLTRKIDDTNRRVDDIKDNMKIHSTRLDDHEEMLLRIQHKN